MITVPYKFDFLMNPRGTCTPLTKFMSTEHDQEAVFDALVKEFPNEVPLIKIIAATYFGK